MCFHEGTIKKYISRGYGDMLSHKMFEFLGLGNAISSILGLVLSAGLISKV